MPIQEQNIVFVESQVMDDVPEGGGAATGTAIVDGQMNNVFEDISDLDRAYGRFNLRKLFLAVRALNTDLYGGAKSVITALPTDPALNYTLFTTDDPFDTRTSAADAVEAYLFKSSTWPGALHENHIAGMRSISVIQRVGTALPPVGKTLCLVEDENLAGEKEQYVRVIAVEAVETTFTDTNGEFTRWIVRMDLSDALRFDFDGHSASRYDSYNYTGKCRIRDTTVADATLYYGSQPLAVAGSIGDLSVRAASMYTQLVPSAQTETPLVEQVLNPNITITLSAGARSVEIAQQAQTLARDVTEENRRFNWIETLFPLPQPGAFSLSYMAQGNWYVLQDDGAGIISGSSPSFGSGTLNYTTGSMAVTLGALPDAGSQILMIWGVPAHYTQYVGNPGIDTTPTIKHDVGEPIKPGTLVLTWLQGGVTKTATGAVNGTISGDGAGYVSHTKGNFVLNLTTTPDSNSMLGIDYESQVATQQTFTGVVKSGGLATVNVGEAIEPGSITAEWATTSRQNSAKVTTTRVHTKAPPGGVGVPIWSSQVSIRTVQTSWSQALYEHIAVDYEGEIGGDASTINYTTGAITLVVEPNIIESNWVNKAWTEGEASSEYHTFANPGVITITYTPAGAVSEVVSTEIALPAMRFKVLPRLVSTTVVPNSVRFTWNGKTFDDVNGTLYTDIDQETGSGTVAGTIDYQTGYVELSYYASGSGAVTVTSLLGLYGDWSTSDGFFRTQLAPLKPESLQLVAVTADGEQLVATADADGLFTHEYIQGSADYSVGVAAVTFGKWVADAGLTEAEKAEPWYNADNIVNGNIYKPRPVMPSTLKYNAVSYSYIPLDADILGVDAVRLPSDGRVPIYRPGGLVVILHSATTAPATLTDGQSISCGRTRLAWVKVFDVNGDVITDGFTLDRDLGTVTFPDVTGLSQPLTVRHTVADLRMITDAQISGQLTLARPLTHEFPADETIVASALIHGDRRARVSAVWDQASWNSTWTDSLVGSAATATLNTIDYPITVTNEGCDTDRWILRWTSTTAAELISEKRGLVWSGSYTAGGADIAPINPRTRNQDGGGGVPYLTIPGNANGGGWASGNVVRINTIGAIADFWIARSVLQSDPPAGDGADGCEIYALGNIDRP